MDIGDDDLEGCISVGGLWKKEYEQLAHAKKRTDVYKQIDAERQHQINRWAHGLTEQPRPVESFVLIMQHYLTRAIACIAQETGDVKAREDVRKIAALAVACLEINPAPDRVFPNLYGTGPESEEVLRKKQRDSLLLAMQKIEAGDGQTFSLSLSDDKLDLLIKAATLT